MLYALSAIIMLAMLGGCQKNEPYYVENPNWHVFYEGRIWDPEYHDYTDLIVVNGPTSRENYLVGWATVEEFNRMGVEGVIDEWIYQYEQDLDYYNSDPYKDRYYTWTDICYNGPSEVGFGMHVDVPCIAIAIAFAIYSFGEPTGSYALSETFTPGIIGQR